MAAASGVDFLPAAGYRNDTSLNNAGSNGNYWSRSLNTSSSDNAYNLYFNSSSINTNNNNRYQGQSVRPVRVQHLSCMRHVVFPLLYSMAFSREQLLLDLYQAYRDARRHKGKKPYVRRFEARLEQNLTELCDELWERRYKARPSECFLISDPKKREVFAADFRDRIVHHLYYNYTHEALERTFIRDSYSCIKGRGTHDGINRLEQHIRRESHNWQLPCYVLKMDIRGYFMHIDRERLLEITLKRLHKDVPVHRDLFRTTDLTDLTDCGDYAGLTDSTDSPAVGFQTSSQANNNPSNPLSLNSFPLNPLSLNSFPLNPLSLKSFLCYLTREIVLLDPTEGCRIKGNPADWQSLPRDKSLFFSPKGCGLPIGNLTSQLFSNVYLGRLDDYMKRTLKCRHYGRYVDDFYVVSTSREWLRSLIPKVRQFLDEALALTLHEGKVRICSVYYGVEFLGAYLKPHRRYVSNATLRRMRRKLPSLALETNPERLRSRQASFRGVLSHYKTGWLSTVPAFSVYQSSL